MSLPTYAIHLLAWGGAIIVWGIISAILIRIEPFGYTKRKPYLAKWPKHIAHRGGSLIGPENSLLAFERSAANPIVDMLEMDLQVTKDGVIIVSHDEKLERQTGVVGAIADTNYADLKPLLRSIKLDFPTTTTAYYTMSDEDFEQYGLQPMPRFEEVLERCPDKPMHVDCKALDETLPAKVIQLIKAYRRESITVVGSTFGKNGVRVQDLAADDPSIVTFASMPQVIVTILLYYIGILPLIPFRYDVYNQPVPTEQMKKIFNIPILPWLLRVPKLWAHLRRRGIFVIAFMMTSKDSMEEVISWTPDVDAFLTDDPAIFDTVTATPV